MLKPLAPELAEHLTHRLGLSVQLESQNRADQRAPHLSKVVLATVLRTPFPPLYRPR